MARDSHPLRNLTTKDFIFGNTSQASNFWLIAYNSFQYLENIIDTRERYAITANLTRQYPNGRYSNTLSLAVTNASVTNAIRQFLPEDFRNASHPWICGQFQTPENAAYFLNQVGEEAYAELCHGITIRESLLATGSFPSMLIYALVLSLSITAVSLYLILAVKTGPRDTFYEAFPGDRKKDKQQDPRLLPGIPIWHSGLQYSIDFHNLSFLWLLTVIFFLVYTTVWFVFGNINTKLLYNYASKLLATRISMSFLSCTIPLAYRFFELQEITGSSFGTGLIWAWVQLTALSDLYTALGPLDAVGQQNLFYRERPCSGQYFASSLLPLRALIGWRYAMLTGMTVLALTLYELPRVLADKLKNKDHQQWHGARDQIWSLIHPFKIWVAMELFGLAQNIYAVWWIREKVLEDGLYANPHGSKFDGYVFMLVLLAVLAAQLSVLLVMDLKVRWRHTFTWKKVQETVDGSDETYETELEDFSAAKE